MIKILEEDPLVLIRAPITHSLEVRIGGEVLLHEPEGTGLIEMIVHHVEDNGDPAGMGAVDEHLQISRGAISRLDREVRVQVVSPRVARPPDISVVHHRHQFQGIHSKRIEVRDQGRQFLQCSLVRPVRLSHISARALADVQFVDYQSIERWPLIARRRPDVVICRSSGGTHREAGTGRTYIPTPGVVDLEAILQLEPVLIHSGRQRDIHPPVLQVGVSAKQNRTCRGSILSGRGDAHQHVTQAGDPQPESRRIPRSAGRHCDTVLGVRRQCGLHDSVSALRVDSRVAQGGVRHEADIVRFGQRGRKIDFDDPHRPIECRRDVRRRKRIQRRRSNRDEDLRNAVAVRVDQPGGKGRHRESRRVGIRLEPSELRKAHDRIAVRVAGLEFRIQGVRQPAGAASIAVEFVCQYGIGRHATGSNALREDIPLDPTLQRSVVRHLGRRTRRDDTRRIGSPIVELSRNIRVVRGNPVVTKCHSDAVRARLCIHTGHQERQQQS